MKKVNALRKQFGVQLAEWTLILVFLGMAAIVGMTTFGGQISGFFEDITAQLKRVFPEQEALLAMGKEVGVNTLVPDETFKDSNFIQDLLSPQNSEETLKPTGTTGVVPVETTGTSGTLVSLTSQETSPPTPSKSIPEDKGKFGGIGNVVPPPAPGEKQECFSGGLCVNVPDPTLKGSEPELNGGLGGEDMRAFAKQMDQIAAQLELEPNGDPKLAKLIRKLAIEGHHLANEMAAHEALADASVKSGTLNQMGQNNKVQTAYNSFADVADELDGILDFQLASAQNRATRGSSKSAIPKMPGGMGGGMSAFTQMGSMSGQNMTNSYQQQMQPQTMTLSPAQQAAKKLIGAGIQDVDINFMQTTTMQTPTMGMDGKITRMKPSPSKKTTADSNQICNQNTSFGGTSTSSCIK